MIDWHSHILPKMDDGSRSVEESLEILHEQKRQGADVVLATPHFYANEESVDEFLERRERCFDVLSRAMDSDCPRVLCGAEVRYYPGIGSMEGLDRLAIEGTDVLLLEMPMTKWTEYTIKELVELASTKGLTVVMAHIERYMEMQGEGNFRRLLESGMLMQVNATFFEGFFSKHKAMKLLDYGKIHLIGSDAHNMRGRAPKLNSAFELIEKKFGQEYLTQMDEFGKELLGL